MTVLRRMLTPQAAIFLVFGAISFLHISAEVTEGAEEVRNDVLFTDHRLLAFIHSSRC